MLGHLHHHSISFSVAVAPKNSPQVVLSPRYFFNMKAILITLFALVAAPVFGEIEEIATSGTQYSGSLAGRAATEIQASAEGTADTDAVAPAITFCRLPTSAVSGAPAGAANIDGMSMSLHH